MMTNDMDFKYVLQDFSNVYIGMRLTYAELSEQDDTPQKLRSAIYQYVRKEAGENERICDHVLRMTDDSQSYIVFSQLKAQFKVTSPVEITDKKGKKRTEYQSRNYSIAELVHDEQLRSSITPDQITEFMFKKRNLMSLAV